MVNRLYNKQVSPKGYFLGGRVKKKKKEEEESKKRKKPKDLIYKPKKMERLKELKEMLK
tara:strand:+ start:43 stop:219 length:177 start_codon:yes stop_codon:yes gene_type:complete